MWEIMWVVGVQLVKKTELCLFAQFIWNARRLASLALLMGSRVSFHYFGWSQPSRGPERAVRYLVIMLQMNRAEPSKITAEVAAAWDRSQDSLFLYASVRVSA